MRSTDIKVVLDIGVWTIVTSNGDKLHMELYHLCNDYSENTMYTAILAGVCHSCEAEVPGDVKAIIALSDNYTAVLTPGAVYDGIDVLHWQAWGLRKYYGT